MRLRVSQIQRLITEELIQLIREQDSSNAPVGNSNVGTVVTYYPMTEGDDDIIAKEVIEDDNLTITLHRDGQVTFDYDDGSPDSKTKTLEWKEFLDIPDASWDASLKDMEFVPGGHSANFSKDIHQKIIDAAKEHQGDEGSGSDSSDDDYQWDDEKLKFDLDVHDLDQAPSLFTRGDNVVLETDEYDIDIPKKVFKAFAAKL